MTRRAIGAIPYLYPVPIVWVGALVDGVANFATVGDCAVMGIQPPLLAVSLAATHHTTRGILDHGTFSVSLPTTADLELVDAYGQVSGRDIDKSSRVRHFIGELGTAPMAACCPVAIECRVVHCASIEHRRIFIGEVVETYVEEQSLDAETGRPRSLTELDPILYALDNHYYRVGSSIGVGYREGKPLARELTAGDEA